MTKINLKINGIPVVADEGMKVIEAARIAGINIPTLCYLKDLNEIGACRMCVVEVKNARGLVTACTYPIAEGMEVFTNSEKVIKSRKTTLELLLSNHKKECLSCDRNLNCELQKLCFEYGCNEDRFEGERNEYEKDTSTTYLVRDNSKCILCRRCEAMCKKIQDVAVIGAAERGFNTKIACAFDLDLDDAPCAGCGQCINVCPVGALTERSYIDDVLEALADPKKHVVAMTAPAVRVAIGEEFGFPIGTDVEGKMTAALRRVGFDRVFDVDVGADVTIMEEGTEFINRLTNGGTLPLITSCSPGWIRYIEYNFPQLLGHLSSCKSPQQMTGALIKSYYAEKMKIAPEDIFVVSVMPCTAKKFERTREHQNGAGEHLNDVDIVLTTREAARLIKRKGIMLEKLPDEEFDAPLGISTGAGVIFGATGGVMEAALRTVAEVVLKKPLEKIDFEDVRGTKGIKNVTYKLGDLEVNVVVASGLTNTRKVLEEVANGTSKAQFIEIMTCPGGCVNGGGQPIHCADVLNTTDIRALRAAAIYGNDKGKTLRKSHESPVVKVLYDEFLGEPGSKKAHHLLHTKYVKREKYPIK